MQVLLLHCQGTLSIARLSLGPGRLANHLLTTGERHLVGIVGYVGDKLGYESSAHPARRIVDAFAKHVDARLSLLDDVYDEVRRDSPNL